MAVCNLFLEEMTGSLTPRFDFCARQFLRYVCHFQITSILHHYKPKKTTFMSNIKFSSASLEIYDKNDKISQKKKKKKKKMNLNVSVLERGMPVTIYKVCSM